MKILVDIKGEAKEFTVKKQGPLFMFAYDENGKQYGFAKTYPELIDNIVKNFDKHNEWNALSDQERKVRNAFVAFSVGHMS